MSPLVQKEAVRSPRSLIADCLTLESLHRLTSGSILAIQCRDFYDQSASAILANRFASHPQRGYYQNGPHLGRVGMAYFEATSEQEKHRYYEQALPSIVMLRDTCKPYMNPMDLLRVTLDEIWPAGATLEQIESRRMFVGLVRILEAGVGIRPHQDRLAWDAPQDCFRARQLTAQLAGNIYIQVSPEGGSLELWDVGFEKEQYESYRLPGSVALDRTRLPDPILQIEPRIGDLILFDATRLHCVSSISAGTRITVSCFVGVRNAHTPLSLWS